MNNFGDKALGSEGAGVGEKGWAVLNFKARKRTPPSVSLKSPYASRNHLLCYLWHITFQHSRSQTVFNITGYIIKHECQLKGYFLNLKMNKCILVT